jgi:hypothetical protein
VIEPEVAARLADVRRHLAEAEALLLHPSPANLDACAPRLRESAECLGGALARLTAYRGEEALLAGATGMRRQVKRMARLLENAARLHTVRERALSARVGGYTVAGPAVFRAPGRIWVRG